MERFWAYYNKKEGRYEHIESSPVQVKMHLFDSDLEPDVGVIVEITITPIKPKKEKDI